MVRHERTTAQWTRRYLAIKCGIITLWQWYMLTSMQESNCNLIMVNQVVKLKSYPNIPTMQCSFCCMGKQPASDFSSSEHTQKYRVCRYSQITLEVQRNKMNEKLNLMYCCILDACVLPWWEDRNGRADGRVTFNYALVMPAVITYASRNALTS